MSLYCAVRPVATFDGRFIHDVTSETVEAIAEVTVLAYADATEDEPVMSVMLGYPTASLISVHKPVALASYCESASACNADEVLRLFHVYVPCLERVSASTSKS